MKRTVSVEATCSFGYEIDDEAVSTWDGAKILEVLEKRNGVDGGNAHGELYTEDATMDMLLGHLGIVLCVDGRRMGNIDGWADFPESAASGSPYGVNWNIESVEVSPA